MLQCNALLTIDIANSNPNDSCQIFDRLHVVKNILLALKVKKPRFVCNFYFCGLISLHIFMWFVNLLDTSLAWSHITDVICWKYLETFCLHTKQNLCVSFPPKYEIIISDIGAFYHYNISITVQYNLVVILFSHHMIHHSGRYDQQCQDRFQFLASKHFCFPFRVNFLFI